MSTDILTLTEAKKALAIDTNFSENDSLIQTYIEAISARLDDECGPIVQRTITQETHSGGKNTIYLYKRPVASITTLTEYDGTTPTVLTAHTNSTQTSDQYLLESNKGTIRRMDSGTPTLFIEGYNNIVVTYVAGRYASTSEVTEKFKLAASITLAHIWRSEQGMSSDAFGGYDSGSFSTFTLPKRAMDVLGTSTQKFEIA